MRGEKIGAAKERGEQVSAVEMHVAEECDYS